MSLRLQSATNTITPEQSALSSDCFFPLAGQKGNGRWDNHTCREAGGGCSAPALALSFVDLASLAVALTSLRVLRSYVDLATY